jgi:hypothetical protein
VTDDKDDLYAGATSIIIDPTPLEIRAALFAAMARHQHEHHINMIFRVTYREIRRLTNDPDASPAVIEHAEQILTTLNAVWAGKSENDRRAAEFDLGKLVEQIKNITSGAGGGQSNKGRRYKKCEFKDEYGDVIERPPTDREMFDEYIRQAGKNRKLRHSSIAAEAGKTFGYGRSQSIKIFNRIVILSERLTQSDK